MRRRHAFGNQAFARACACAFVLSLPGVGAAAAQGFDAGGHANLMHQQELLRNQTAGDRDRRGDGQATSRRAMTADDRVQWHRKNLRQEYERRVRVNGRADADAWSARALRELLERDRCLGIGGKPTR